MLRLIFCGFPVFGQGGGLSQDLQRDLEEAINMYTAAVSKVKYTQTVAVLIGSDLTEKLGNLRC